MPNSEELREALESVVRDVICEHPYELKGGWRLTGRLVEAIAAKVEFLSQSGGGDGWRPPEGSCVVGEDDPLYIRPSETCLREIEALETARKVETHVFRKGLVGELRDLPLTITRYGKPVAHVLPAAPTPQVKP